MTIFGLELSKVLQYRSLSPFLIRNTVETKTDTKK